MFTPIGASLIQTGFTVELTNAADLAAAGGEDAVVVRVVGTMQFHALVRPVTSSPGWLRCALFARARTEPGVALNAQAPDLFTVAAQSNENILWMDDVYVTSDDLGVIGTNNVFGLYKNNLLEVDAGAKRRLSEDLQLALTIQGSATNAGVAAPSGVRVSGWLRVLLQAPHI